MAWELLFVSLSEEVQELATEHLEVAEIEAAYNAVSARIRSKATFVGSLKKAVREAQARPVAAGELKLGLSYFSLITTVRDILGLGCITCSGQPIARPLMSIAQLQHKRLRDCAPHFDDNCFHSVNQAP